MFMSVSVVIHGLCIRMAAQSSPVAGCSDVQNVTFIVIDCLQFTANPVCRCCVEHF